MAPRWSRSAHGPWLLVVAACGVFFGLACDREAECTPGTEACVCTQNGGCLPHLECISDYCVDPEWMPPAADDDGVAQDDDQGVAEDEDDDASGADDEAPVDNVDACEAWVDAYECGGFDIGQSLNCDLYADATCDLSDYFDCLTDNTSCTNGFPDTSGWPACVDLATCP